ncbi:MAG: hypothetical protein V3T60_04640 [Candidatus Binatia bacterium]
MGQIARTAILFFVFLPFFFAVPSAEEHPDREILRLMELLEEWEILNNLEPLKQLEILEELKETPTEPDPQNSQWEDKEKEK